MRNSLLTALAISLGAGSFAAQWTNKAFFPCGSCQDGVGFSVNGKGYMGLGTGSPSFSKSLWEYDPTSNTWSQIADFGGGGRWYPTSMEINNKGYVGGGVDTLFNFVNDLWEYDPTANTWTQKSNYPGGGRVGLTSFTINGKGYWGMGGANFGPPYLSDFWEYDPALNTWSARAPVGGPSRAGAHGFANGNYGYCALGANGTTYYTDMWRYDAGADSWTQLNPFPGIGRGNFRCFSIGPIAFLGMGIKGPVPYQYPGDWWMYNTGFDSWTPYPTPPIDGTGAGSFAIGLRGYVRDLGMSFMEFNPFDCQNLLNGPDTVGAACDDNDLCTVNDVWNANCVCTGTFQDTDNDGLCNAIDGCPYLYGQIGDPCNDNNPNTINDMITAGCFCAGTCTGNNLTLTLNTDANALQTSWDIVVGNTSTIVCSGSGYANNSTITANCCLANGCYELRVFDSFGDGINPGGFVLRDPGSNRIIDDAGFGPNFGTTAKVTDVNNNGVSFCIPISSDSMMPGSCDQFGLTLSSVLQATVIPAVSAQYNVNNANSGYQFWVFKPDGGYSRRIFFSHSAPGNGWPTSAPVATRCSYFKLSAMNSTPAIPKNVLLNIRVRGRVNGVNDEFGPACRMALGTPAVCSLNQLTTTANPLVSCGATGLNRLTGVLWSNNVTGANKYQFEFVNANTNTFLRNIASPTRNLNMSTWGSSIALPNCFTPYNIRVRVSFNSGLSYCPWGPVCQVTFNCPPEQAGREMEVPMADNPTLSVWPNPNDGQRLTLALSGSDAKADHIDVTILDAFGREVMSHTYATSNGEVNTTIDLEHALAPGMCIVRVACGEHQFTQRLIIQ